MDKNSTAKERLIFISHSSADTWVAKQIAREIKAQGGTPCLDEAQVDAGADFEEDILKFLERAHELVVLLTHGLLSGRMCGLRLERRGGGEFQSLLYCLGLRPPNCKRGLVYQYSLRSEISYS